MKICGIDPSINSTGKCILELNDDDYNIIGVTFYGYNKVKKHCFPRSSSVEVFHVGTQYTNMNMFDRQNIVYDYMIKDMEDVSHVSFEGYAFGAGSTRAIFQLGEFIGGMKKLYYDMGKGIIIYPPRAVKRFATGNGNADKSQMCNAFKVEYPQFYPKEFELMKQYSDPHGDLCDAFWIAETLRNHLIYDVLGPDHMDEGTVALLESKSTKKSHSIVETELVRRKIIHE
jgi:Holliday junction resolvasome RuvABC endonuclease subunit